jgi:hypothetical protein
MGFHWWDGFALSLVLLVCCVARFARCPLFVYGPHGGDGHALCLILQGHGKIVRLPSWMRPQAQGRWPHLADRRCRRPCLPARRQQQCWQRAACKECPGMIIFSRVSSLHNWLFLELFTLALLSFVLTFHISIGILIAVGSIEWCQDSSTTYITQYKWHGIFEEVNISSTEPRHLPVSMDSFFVMNWQI